MDEPHLERARRWSRFPARGYRRPTASVRSSVAGINWYVRLSWQLHCGWNGGCHGFTAVLTHDRFREDHVGTEWALAFGSSFGSVERTLGSLVDDCARSTGGASLDYYRNERWYQRQDDGARLVNRTSARSQWRTHYDYMISHRAVPCLLVVPYMSHPCRTSARGRLKSAGSLCLAH